MQTYNLSEEKAIEEYHNIFLDFRKKLIELKMENFNLKKCLSRLEQENQSLLKALKERKKKLKTRKLSFA